MVLARAVARTLISRRVPNAAPPLMEAPWCGTNVSNVERCCATCAKTEIYFIFSIGSLQLLVYVLLRFILSVELVAIGLIRNGCHLSICFECWSKSHTPIFQNDDLLCYFPIQDICRRDNNKYHKHEEKHLPIWYRGTFVSKCPYYNNRETSNEFHYPRRKCDFNVDRNGFVAPFSCILW